MNRIVRHELVHNVLAEIDHPLIKAGIKAGQLLNETASAPGNGAEELRPSVPDDVGRNVVGKNPEVGERVPTLLADELIMRRTLIGRTPLGPAVPPNLDRPPKLYMNDLAFTLAITWLPIQIPLGMFVGKMIGWERARRPSIFAAC